MKIIIAPQGFKGGISGLEAARAIARGVLKAAPDAETVLLPVADGGDGTLHALLNLYDQISTNSYRKKFPRWFIR